MYPQVHGQGQLGEPGCDPELVARSSAASPKHIPRGARAVASLGTRGGGERGTGPYPHALRSGSPARVRRDIRTVERLINAATLRARGQDMILENVELAVCNTLAHTIIFMRAGRK